MIEERYEEREKIGAREGGKWHQERTAGNKRSDDDGGIGDGIGANSHVDTGAVAAIAMDIRYLSVPFISCFFSPL